MTNDLILLSRFPTIIEAEMFKNILEEHEIECAMLDANVTGLGLQRGSLIQPRIMIHPSDADKALEVLKWYQEDSSVQQRSQAYDPEEIEARREFEQLMERNKRILQYGLIAGAVIILVAIYYAIDMIIKAF